MGGGRLGVEVRAGNNLWKPRGSLGHPAIVLGKGDHITMKDNESVSQSSNRLGKVIGGLFVVMILGAIGNGL